VLAALAGVLIAGSALAATAPTPAEPPAHFIARVFALYAPKSRWWGDGPGADAYRKRITDEFYDPSFAKLMDDNSTLAAKQGDADLDYDPICQCQDSGGTYRYVSGAAAPGGLFHARIAGVGGQSWTIVLTPSASGWRIYDVIDQTGDLRAWLAQHNACMRRFTKDAPLLACEKGG
jgi:hypothetical protein